jgi:polysaccharide biosynthesis/export protein
MSRVAVQQSNTKCLRIGLYLGLAILIQPGWSQDHISTPNTALAAPAGYLLQAGDEIAVHSIEAKEVADKTYTLDENGEVNFPLVGVLRLSGHGVRETEQALATALKRFYFEPDIAINITGFHIDSMSVLGAVGTPGVHQIKGPTTLLEALSAAGGVRGDAGPVVVLTRQKARGPIPHASAHQMSSGDFVAEIQLKGLLESRSPADDILILPHDVISVPMAELVYVVGDVKKAGGFPLGGKPSLSVLQALALAEGLDVRAAPGRARILRPGTAPGTEKQIPVDLKKILQGKAEDVVLHPNDILFVPDNAMKSISARTIEAAIQIGTGLAIFRP